jgi:hypothetical protein
VRNLLGHRLGRGLVVVETVGVDDERSSIRIEGSNLRIGDEGVRQSERL